MERVFTDLAGPVTPTAINGEKYVMCFTDDYSGMMYHYFLKDKSGATDALRCFISEVSDIGRIKIIRSDNGGEYVSE